MVSLTGIVSTVAGGGSCDLGDDGCSVLDAFVQPSRLAIDSTGNLHFADGYAAFRVDSGSDQVVHVAGNGSMLAYGDGGPCTWPRAHG